MDTEVAQKPYTYTKIPRLKQLLPRTGGLPGVEYAIISTSNMRKAQDLGWERLAGAQKIFTIEGPKGNADCELFGKGAPIRGMDTLAGVRRLSIDPEVRKVTGFVSEPPKGGSDSTAPAPAVKPTKE